MQAKGGVFASDKQASAVFAAAQGYAVKASLLDIMFFHPPSFVALACVLAAAEEAGVREPLARYACNGLGSLCPCEDGCRHYAVRGVSSESQSEGKSTVCGALH